GGSTSLSNSYEPFEDAGIRRKPGGTAASADRFQKPVPASLRAHATASESQVGNRAECRIDYVVFIESRRSTTNRGSPHGRPCALVEERDAMNEREEHHIGR